MKSLFAALFLMPILASAQDASPSPTPLNSRIPMWRCDLSGGTYEVAIRSIISVSTHEYVVDGVARVTEMNIDTAGNVEVRFYYLEPMISSSSASIGQAALDRVQQLANEASSQLNPGDQPPWEKVVKNYPTTTHAHTVEYRMDSKDDLESLFTSAEQAFRLNQNTRIQIQ